MKRLEIVTCPIKKIFDKYRQEKYMRDYNQEVPEEDFREVLHKEMKNQEHEGVGY